MYSSHDIEESIVRTKRFLRTSLSRWATHGYDYEYGGYFEALDFEGNPLMHLSKRFRIHPRSIFSHAYGTIAGYYDGTEIAVRAFDYITNTLYLDTGGFATLSSREGEILDTRIVTYDHSFVMLGFGWLYKLTSNSEHRSWLYTIWNDVLRGRLLHEDGGFITSIPHDGGPMRVQNPHMHMLEAVLNLLEIFGEDVWRDASQQLYGMLERCFIPEGELKLFEFFNDDWTLDAVKGQSLDAGHHYEWVWILEKYARLMGQNVPLIAPLYAFALKGSNDQGMGYDEVTPEGNPIRNTHRIWIQTEVIKANIAMYRYYKDEKYISRIYTAWEQLFSYYLIEEYGIWYDQLDDTLSNISENAPTSILYHVLIGLDEYIQCMESLSSSRTPDA